MAISPDPVQDLKRCADLLDQAVTLLNVGSFKSIDIVSGLATRIRTNTAMVEQGKRGDDPDFVSWLETLPHLSDVPRG